MQTEKSFDNLTLEEQYDHACAELVRWQQAVRELHQKMAHQYAAEQTAVGRAMIAEEGRAPCDCVN